MHLQPFLYGSVELGDDLLRVRTPDYCSARDNHVSNSLRGEGGRRGRGERRRGGREKGGGEGGRVGRGERGRKREEKREGKKGKGGGRSHECTHTHTHTHTHTSLTSQIHFHNKRRKGLVSCVYKVCPTGMQLAR